MATALPFQRKPTQPPQTDLPLPQALEAEKAVLGAIMLDNAALAIALRATSVNDFFLPQHKAIFAAMFDVANAGAPIDTITVMERLAAEFQLEAAGGVAYLSTLADGLPNLTNV